MAITNITPLPTPPTRQDPANFAERADTFLAALPAFTTEVNTAGDQIEAAEQAAEDAQIAAENAADAAALSANSASVTANAAVWVSGFAYSQYSNAIDPVDYRTYRAKNAVTSATRPALDLTNWALLSAQGDVTTDTNQTITSVKTFTQPIVGSTTTQVLKTGDTMTGPLTATVLNDSKGDLRDVPSAGVKSTSYTLVAADAGQHVVTSATVTVPSGVFSNGDVVVIVNDSAAAITINFSVTAYISGIDSVKGAMSLRPRGMLTLLFANGKCFAGGAAV